MFAMAEAGLQHYVACSNVIAYGDLKASFLAGGAVTMSGYGDGMYKVNIGYNISKEIVSVKINFSDEE